MTQANQASQFCGRTRREFLWEAGAGFTGLALTDMLSADGFFQGQLPWGGGGGPGAYVNPLRRRGLLHYAPKAKSVIFLFMYGGPSHLDTFDYKPTLYGLNGRTITVQTFGRGGRRNQGRVIGPHWRFSTSTASAANGSATCFPTSPLASMTLLSCTRCTPILLSTARPC